MSKRILENQLVVDFLWIVAGCFVTAFAVNSILVPNNLSTSGITGLALIVQKFTGINYTYVYYLFSITILVTAFVTMGKKAVLKIIFVSLLYPALLVVMNKFHFVFVEGDMFLVCIYFSLFYGVGGGMVLRRGYTFGGTDTIARILNKKVFKKCQHQPNYARDGRLRHHFARRGVRQRHCTLCARQPCDVHRHHGLYALWIPCKTVQGFHHQPKLHRDFGIYFP